MPSAEAPARSGSQRLLDEPHPQFPTPRLEVVRSDAGFRQLFEGFRTAHLVSYVADPTLLLDLFEREGFVSVDLIPSERFQDFRDRLNRDAVRALMDRVEGGSLRLFVPRAHAHIHTKLYLLENGDRVRLLFSSRNLSASRSLDIVLLYDLDASHAFVGEVRRALETHREVTVPFFGDLPERIRAEPASAAQFIDAYLADPESATDAVPALLADATRRAIVEPELEVLKIQIPESPRQRKRIESELAKTGSFAVRESEGVYHVDLGQFRGVVSRTVQVPVLVVDPEHRRLTELVSGEVRERSRPPPADPASIDRALELVERYATTVDAEAATSRQKEIHKTALFEVLLYLFAAPFAHELMKLYQQHYGLVQKRGPRFLLIHGQSHRGKTTYLAFVLALLAGVRVEPLSAKMQFREGFIRQALAYRTTFPLVFDDMLSISSPQFEGLVKDYWEKNWSRQEPVPQLVFSTNRGTLRQSVATRVKKVYFPVFIEPTPEKKKTLNSLREAEVANPLFVWFAFIYLDLLATHSQPPPEDELYLARLTLRELYRLAGRPRPSYFPDEPFERWYDSSREEWADMLFELRKAEWTDAGDRILIQFTRDMSREDIQHYVGILPLWIDHEVKGNTVVIHSAPKMREWLPRPASPPPGPSTPAPSVGKGGLGHRFRRLLGRAP